MAVRVLCFSFTVALCGCFEVVSLNPMGESALKLNPAEWDGVWLLSDDDLVIFKVANPDDGLIEASFLERGESGPVFKRSTVYVREAEGWVFISMAQESEGATDVVGYSWGRLKKDGNTLIVWMPDHDKFESLVDEGILPGDTRSTDVHLGILESSHYAVITSEQRGVLFEWDNPIIFRRPRE
jgi:hypothetical protein